MEQSHSEMLYRVPPPELCQGDIIRSVPHIHLKDPPLKALRNQSAKGGNVFRPYEYDRAAQTASQGMEIPPKGFNFGSGELVPAFCQVALGILLTYDCDIDNERKHRLVALIRPLANVRPEDQQFIRDNKNFALFYLPPYGDKLLESYVDLRRITTLSPQYLDGVERIVSLTPTGVKALQTQLILSLTHRELTEDLDAITKSNKD